ncbi:hypothetical protein TeGR_g785, partial [Tetraparma gracilis]
MPKAASKKKAPAKKKLSKRSAAAAEESDSDADVFGAASGASGASDNDMDLSSDEEDLGGFDPTMLIRDEEDRQYLQELGEFEREAILAERYDEKTRELEMKRVLKEQGRSSGRDKDVSGKKTKTKQAREDLLRKKRLAAAESEDDYGSDEDEDDGDEEYGADADAQPTAKPWETGSSSRATAASAADKEQPEVTFEQMKESQIVLRRDTLKNWVHEPYFKDAVVGAFVKLNIGKKEGRVYHRLCEVVAVDSANSKVYVGAAERFPP